MKNIIKKIAIQWCKWKFNRVIEKNKRRNLIIVVRKEKRARQTHQNVTAISN